MDEKCLIYCLPMKGNFELDNNLMLMLFFSAYVMYFKKNDKFDFHLDYCEGTVYTKHEMVTAEGVSGILFHAEIYSKKGEIALDYLVRKQDIHLIFEQACHVVESFDDLLQRSNNMAASAILN